jgi:hypothetical protein
MKSVYACALWLVTAAFCVSIAVAGEVGGPNKAPTSVQNGFAVRGTVHIAGVPKSRGNAAFESFAKQNVAKYASCADMLAEVQITDGTSFKAPLAGNINTGECTFTVHVKGTSAPISLVKIVNAQGILIGLRQARHTQSADTYELERWSFTFQKIDVENKLGKTMASDDWHQ